MFCWLLFLLLAGCTQQGSEHNGTSLPPEVWETIILIENDGPYPYRQDGSIFYNHEHLLPQHGQGYYREYTVPTPGVRHRGARRIVTGGRPPQQLFYYSADHYKSFMRIHPEETPRH